MAKLPRPDFGMHQTTFHGLTLECRYVAPGLTFSDLYRVYDEAEKAFQESDNLHGSPTHWRGARGMMAVTNAILDAIYEPPTDGEG